MKTHITNTIANIFMQPYFFIRDMFLYVILDTLFPKKYVGGYNKPKTNSQTPPNNRSGYTLQTQTFYGLHTAFLPYQNPSIKKSIWNFKYYMNPTELRRWAELVSDELIAYLSDTLSHVPLSHPVSLIYCPSSSYLSGTKNFDHMEILTHELAYTACSSWVVPYFDALTIVPSTSISKPLASQHTLNRAKRFEWSNRKLTLSDSFISALTKDSPSLICIDDITTTGATFALIQQEVFNKTHIKTDCFALCH